MVVILYALEPFFVLVFFQRVPRKYKNYTFLDMYDINSPTYGSAHDKISLGETYNVVV